MTARRMLVVPAQSALVEQFTAAMRLRLPDWAGYDSDPLTYAADILAADRIALMQAANDAADASWLFTATGGALEDIVAQYGLARIVGETDAQLRVRAVGQFQSRSIGTPESVLADARAALPEVADVSFQADRANNRINIWLAVTDDTSPVPTAAQRTAVSDYINADSRRPIWLTYDVQPCVAAAYTVAGAITYRRGAPSPEADVRARLTAFIADYRGRLNRRLATSAIVAAMWAPGVVDIDLTSPSADVAKALAQVNVGVVGALTFTEEA